MSQIYEQMALDGLVDLKMTKAAEVLDSITQQAAANEWSYSHFLGRLIESEQQFRLEKTSLWPIKWRNSLT